MAETKPTSGVPMPPIPGRLAALMERGRQMPAGQRARWGAVAAASALLLAGLLWWGTRTEWRTLYAGLDPEDARSMSQQLTAAGISFDVSADGATLKVPAEQLDKARLATTATGGPHSGRMGFEIFDKPNWVGSDFDEKVNYQRALEGELEHTISTISEVRSARVHLVLPHDSLFTDEQRVGKASVVLTLRHRTIPDDSADAIRNLVAAAVDGLKPENVVLVSADGTALGGRQNPDAAARTHEQELAAKVVEMLEPAAGPGNVRASVNVDYDTSSADETDETYDPNSSATLSMQRSERTAGAQPVAAGVPGTASNAPNVKPPLFPQQTTSAEDSKEESSTYGVSKKVRHLTRGPGKVRRITVAVLVNERAVIQGKRVTWQPRSPAEMKQLTDLAQAAVGYDNSRGDLVTVEDVSFDQTQQTAPTWQERTAETLQAAQPLFHPGALLVCLLLAVLLVFRPLIRTLSPPPAAAAALPGPRVNVEIGDGADPEVAAEQLPLERRKARAQAIFDQVAERVNKEPGQSSRLLQSWIHSE